MTLAQKSILSDIESTLSTLAAEEIGYLISESLHEIAVAESLASALAAFEGK